MEGGVKFSELQVGDLCYYHHKGVPCRDPEHLAKLHLTAQYFEKNSKRPPLILALPNHQGGPLYFLVDGQCYSPAKGHYDGWVVTGEPPLISISPSVDYPGHYHGTITNGVIGDG